jgi:large subunit ribosomal protein L29
MAPDTTGIGSSAAELRELEDDELLSRLREAKEELFNLRFQSATGQLDNHRRLQVVRRNIARIYTVMRERELGLHPVEQSAGVEHASTAASTGSTT